MKRRLVVVRLALALYAAFVATMSLKPFRDAPLDRAIDSVGRAYFHLPAYAGLALLLVAALPPKGASAQRAGIACAVATSYGWLLEVAQLLAPTRSFNVRGLLFDLAGAVAGAAVALLWLRREERRRRA